MSIIIDIVLAVLILGIPYAGLLFLDYLVYGPTKGVNDPPYY